MTDDEMRLDPLTKKLFEGMSSSAHAFWKMELQPSCHPQAHLSFTYFGPSGLIEASCLECSKLIGVIKVAEE